MPSCVHDRQQDRHQDRDRRGRLEEAADEEHQQVGEQQEHPRVVREREHPARRSSSVTRVAVSIQPKIDAAATMNSTVAVVSMVSIETLISIFQFSVRYQTRPEEERPDARGDRALGRR